ncbi:MAG: hypothetical protein P8176_08795 [Gammaproteobacteria bacterium]
MKESNKFECVCTARVTGVYATINGVLSAEKMCHHDQKSCATDGYNSVAHVSLVETRNSAFDLVEFEKN